MTQSRAKRAEISEGLSEVSKALAFGFKPDFVRRQRVRAPRVPELIAYDLETTRIEVGTPQPLYITAYNPRLFHFEKAILDMEHLHDILVTHFLVEAHKGCRFVAWNGNRFDAYFIAAALIRDTRFRLYPYLTKNKALRGLRVALAEDADNPHALGWEFLCGIAMTGLTGVSLEKFLKTFAPDHAKLTGVVDFEKEQFTPTNLRHREYAMRDSVGLWHGMDRAQRIMLDTFHEPLGVTMGGACIKIFAAHLPRDTVVEALIPAARSIVTDYVMRGGYCFCVKRYHGPVWKYDLNQAYAAAMREARLPSGSLLKGTGIPYAKSECFIARVTAHKRGNLIPFYYRTEIAGRIRSVFGTDEIRDTWLTSIEVRQLIREGWQMHIAEHWTWAKSFDMREYVDKLETLRTTCDGGPSGPIGTMIKATGNHSYGKTAEEVAPISFVLASEQPPDYLPFYDDDGDSPIEHVYYKLDRDRKIKAHHQPQLAAFITAHVRMVVRRAALIRPRSWLYADTDCVMFDSDVTAELDIDPKRYGAWKIEEEGKPYRLIAKKVYAEDTPGGKRSAKGLNVRRLSDDDFARWHLGNAPVQDQVQINNFLETMRGAEMYRAQRRKGTKVDA